MGDIYLIAKAYLRAYRLAHAVSKRLPTEIENANDLMLRMANHGDSQRASADMCRFAADVWSPLCSLIERQLVRGHEDILLLLKIRLSFYEFLHTLASENGRFEETQILATQIHELRTLLVEDLIGGSADADADSH